MRFSRGFTLIEMLVLVAIIGILAAIVIASTIGSKNRGSDTAFKADLMTIQTQATLYYDIGNTYGMLNSGGSATCGQDTNGNTVFYDRSTSIDTPIQNAVSAAAKDISSGSLTCESQSGWFMAYGKLSDGNYWCIDSSNPLQDGVEIGSAPSGNTCSSQGQ